MKLRIWCPLCPDKKASNGKKRKGDVKSDVSEKDVRQRYQQHFYSLHKAQYPNEKYPGAIPPVWSWNDAKGEWHKDDDGREGGVYVEPPTARQVLADCRLLGETLPAWAEHAWYTNRPDDRDPALARPPAPAPQHPPPTPAAPTPAAAAPPPPAVSAPAPPPTPATAPDARQPLRTCEYGLIEQHQLLKLLGQKTLYLGNVPPGERKVTLHMYQLMKKNSKLYKIMKQYQLIKQHHQHQAKKPSPPAAPMFRIVAKRKALPSLAAAAPPPPLADDPPGYDHNASFSDAAEIENSVEQYLGPRPQPTSQLRQNSVDVSTQTEPQSADPRFQKPPEGWADAADSLLGATPKASLVFSAKCRALPMPNPAPPAAGAPPPDVIGVNRELEWRDVEDLCSVESSTSSSSVSSGSVIGGTSATEPGH